MTECSIEEGLCSQEQNCDLRGNWQRISLAVADALQQVSLAEMASPAGRANDPLRITTLNFS
jgi:DNA-binding IscR family transcriptional regulator